jgi:hypothetical protein
MKSTERRVYVSSTFVELPDFRQALTEALLQSGYEPIGPVWPRMGSPASALALDELRASDAYIGFVGRAYGEISDPANPDGPSITEIELEAAVTTLGRERCLFGLLLPERPHSSAESPVGESERIVALRRRLEQQFHVHYVSAPSDMTKLVEQLSDLIGNGRRTEPSEPPSRGTSGGQTAEPVAPNQPLTRLSEFQTADSVRDILQQALVVASGQSLNLLDPLATFFALKELAGPEDGPWAATFLRDELTRRLSPYDRVRASFNDPSPRRKGQAEERQPVAMTAAMFAFLELAADLAQRTTGRRVIHARHLLGALLADTPAFRDSQTVQLLEMLQVPPAELRVAFYDWMRGYGDQDEVWAEVLVGVDTMPARRRLGGYTADHGVGADLLGIRTDVQAFAALIAARTVAPPLSIGLFGEWGSGKTFFMRELLRAVDELSADARRTESMQRELPFYKHIAQIEFNAWHYVESNLWASLVEHILENLYQRKDPLVTRQLQEGLIKKLADETALARATNAAVDTAKAATKQAEKDLTTAQQQLDAKAAEVATLSRETVLKDFVLTGAAQPIGRALKGLGIDQVGQSAIELDSALRRIHGILGRGQGLLAPLLYARDRGRRLVWLVLTLVGATAVGIVVTAVVGTGWYAQLGAIMTGLATAISGGVTWLKQQTAWVSARLDEAEEAQQAYDAEMARETADHVARVTAAEQKLRELMSALEVAQRGHAEAKSREAAAAAEAKAATTGRLLASFISDRAASTDYRKHLGMLALVRDDFEKLSGLIEEENWRLSPGDYPADTHRGGLKPFADLAEERIDADQRINRIVLYIDDLDRCPPNKVVDVLQAVHLLLAFPLFVVVVGVDARWITKSLEARYRELLRLDGAGSTGEESPLLGAATPNDYLEKIFQVPFWLKPMNSKATAVMVRGLLQSSLVKPAIPGDQDATSGVHPPAGAGAPSDDGPAPAPPGEPPAGDSGAGVSEAPKEPALASPPVLDLSITPEELDYMAKLSSLLGRSPRALKRFVNVYRLIKAGLEEYELQAFTRQRGTLADYQAVLLLLAVDTGTPLAAREFHRAIEAVLAADHGVTARSLTTRMGKEGSSGTDSRRLRDWLTTPQEAISKDTDLSLLGMWLDRVGRFSFEIGRS